MIGGQRAEVRHHAQSMSDPHKWLFKARFRERAFGWRGSKTAVVRLREATSEIKAVARSDAIAAADGVVTLAERIWPALQDIDTSSGELGNAVNRTLEELLPTLIGAPADPATRHRWLERLHEAVQNDGVQYLWPIEDRWGEVAVYPELMNDYADALLPLLRRVWTQEPPGGYVVGTAICLSSLLELGRFDDLLAILQVARGMLWEWRRFGAEALARQGLWDAAIAYAEGSRDTRLTPHDDGRIARFCEQVLLRAGRHDQAYREYGLRVARGPTYLATYRETIRRYPHLDRHQVLLDLIEVRGNRGKWFAAAKSAGYLDVALDCARSFDVEPATLVRAACDFSRTDSRFALDVGLLALQHLLDGRGFEPDPSLIWRAADSCLAAAAEIGLHEWARSQIRHISDLPHPAGQQTMQSALAAWLVGAGPPTASVAKNGSSQRDTRRRRVAFGRR
jgi:hypothetical protein